MTRPPLTTAGHSAPEPLPLYARVLRLRQLRLSSLMSFVLLEGMFAIGVLLALTELVSWWAVPVLPLTVAAMVKLNDLVAGAWRGDWPRPPDLADDPAAGPAVAASIPAQPPIRTVRQVSRDVTDSLDPVNSPRQRFRQSARRRYR